MYISFVVLAYTEILNTAQKHLDNSIPSKTPLMAELVPLSVLRAEYEGSDSFIKQIDFLSTKGYDGIRRSRGDGDCFYRCMCHCTTLPALLITAVGITLALAFAYIERIFDKNDKEMAVVTSISTLEETLKGLQKVGFDKSVIDEAYEVPRDLIRGIIEPDTVSNSGQTLTPPQLLEVFQDDTCA